jgi:Fe-S-cluster containining protein
MDISAKLKLLDRIYEICDEFSASLRVACRRYCAHCCTGNVTMTSLEAYNIVEYLINTQQTQRLDVLKEQLLKPRFQPKITTNALALCYLEGREPPEEESDPAWGICPFLTDNECPIYPARPLGCRCFVSRLNCREIGAADIEEFVLTVNTVFLQYIEHLDTDGLFGNFSDILMFMAEEHNRKHDLSAPQAELIANMPIRVLMIPPEHRQRIQPILHSLSRAIRL